MLEAVIIAGSEVDLQAFLEKIATTKKNFGLKINAAKTMVISKNTNARVEIYLHYQHIEQVSRHK